MIFLSDLITLAFFSFASFFGLVNCCDFIFKLITMNFFLFLSYNLFHPIPFYHIKITFHLYSA